MRQFGVLLALWAVARTQPAGASELLGRVVTGGEPAAGARVEARPLPDPVAEARREARGEPRAPALASGAAGPDGSFRLALSEAPQVVELWLQAAGAVPRRLRVALEADTSRLPDVELAGGRSLSGRILDAAGEPLGGVLVELLAGADGLPQRTLSDPSGVFAFDGAHRFENRLRFEARGLASRALAAPAGALASPVHLAPGLPAGGTVLGPDGVPVAGALVRYEGEAASRWVETDASGRFLLEDLSPGEGRVVALGDGVAAAPLGLPRTDGAPIELRLRPGARVEGRVVDSRGGADLAAVVLVARGPQGDRLLASDTRGRYALADLLPGALTLEVEDPRFAPLALEIENLAAGERRRADLVVERAASVSGIVVDTEGAPVAGAGGRVLDPGRRFRVLRFSRGGDEPDPDFVSGADGRFHSRRLSPGTGLMLAVQHPDHAPAEVGLELPPGGAVDGLRVVLSPGARLTGRVVDEAGRPLAGAWLRAFPAPRFGGRGRGFALRQGFEPRETESGARGDFAYAGLEPGLWMLQAGREGYGDSTAGPIEVPGDAAPVEIALRPGVAIAGWLVRPDGSPAAGLRVTAFRDDARPGPFGGGVGASQPSGVDGSFRIEGLEDSVSYQLGTGRPFGTPPIATVEAPASGVELQVPGVGRIEGRVVDAESGAPVPRYRITAMPEGGGGRPGRFGMRSGFDQEVEDPEGAFALEEVGEGSWQVSVQAPEYQRAQRDAVPVTTGEGATRLELRLRRGIRVEGRVIDARSRRPVPGAAVRAEPASGRQRPFGPRDAGPTTDAEGRFAIGGLAPGPWQLAVSHPDYTDASERVDLGDGDASLEIELRAGASAAGVVLSPSGVPTAGVDVTLSPAGGDRFEAQSNLSDGLGGFHFRNLAAGRYELSASQRGLLSAAIPLTLAEGDDRQGLVLSLEGGATLRIRVAGLAPEELAATQVSASGPDGYRDAGPVDASGNAELHGAPAGPIDVSAAAMSGGLRTARSQVLLEPGQLEATVDLRFGDGYVLEGRVTRAGEAVSGVRVVASAAGAGRGGGFSMSVTEADGSYRILDLQPDVYQVVVENTARETTVQGDTRLDLELPTARIRGVVLEAGTGTPIAEALVEARSPDASPGDRTLRTTTDSEGLFELSPLEPGSWSLAATRPGYEATQVEAVAGEAARTVTLELRRGAGLALRVFDALLGAPLRGVRASARDASGLAVFDGPVALDGAGRGEIPSLPPGSWAIHLQASGYAPVELRVSVPAAPLDVGLTPGGGLELRAGPETLAQLPTSCRLLGPGGAPQPVAGSDPSGAFTLRGPALRLEHVVPGRYTLTTSGGASVDLVVVDGQLRIAQLP